MAAGGFGEMLVEKYGRSFWRRMGLFCDFGRAGKTIQRRQRQPKGLFCKNGTVLLGNRFCCENDVPFRGKRAVCMWKLRL